MAVGVIHRDQLVVNPDFNGQLFAQLTADGVCDDFIRLLLTAWKFPETAQQSLIEALIDQNLSCFIQNHTHTNHLKRDVTWCLFHGVLLRRTGSVSSTVRIPGTKLTGRTTGSTDRGSKIHQCLIEIAAQAWNGINQPFTPGPKLSLRPHWRLWMGMQPGQHPTHIAVQDGQRAVEGRRQDATGCAAADTGQCQPGLLVERPITARHRIAHNPLMALQFSEQQPRCGVQAAGT